MRFNWHAVDKWVVKTCVVLIASVIVLVPFHAVISVGLGDFVGGYDVARAWKEILFAAVLLGAIYLFCRRVEIQKKLIRWPVFWLGIIYILLHLVAAVIAVGNGAVPLQAAFYACVLNLRFVLFFGACLVVVHESLWLRRHWLKLVLVPAAVVVMFGLLQVFVLPPDILRHVGYGPDSIPAIQTVDQKAAFVRAQSTLRGSNPLGAYLVVVCAAILAVMLQAKRRLGWALVLATSLLLLAVTYSRSAYIGAVLAGAVLIFIMMRSAAAKRWVLVGVGTAILCAATGALVLRNNDLVQNIFFHTDEHSLSSRSSNADRMAALRQGAHDVLSEPLGRGPGSAGPASFYAGKPARIAENYYLQIGQEVGWLGLGLLVAIVVMVGRQLWRLRTSNPLAALLVASLLGLSVVNLLSHAWTDDTLAYLWWGLAGIALSPAILKIRTKGGSNYERVYKTNKKAT